MKRLVPAVISILLFGAAFWLIEREAFTRVLSQLAPSRLGLAFGFLLANLGLAYARFHLSFRILGFSAPAQATLGPFFAGQLANLLPFGVIGQAATRSAMLAQAGVSAASVTFLSLLERIIALGSLAALAVAGVIATFGSLSLDSHNLGTGPAAFWVMAGVVGVVPAVFMAVRSQVPLGIPEMMRAIRWPPVLAIAVLSVVAHLGMLAAYWTVLASFGAPGPSAGVLGALAIVMFVSALPISFAGWGLREFSAIQALGAVGVPEETGLATGLTIGILSTAVIGLCVAGLVLSRWQAQRGTASPDIAEPGENRAFDTAFVTVLGLLTAALLPFQMRIPLEGHDVVVNLADLFAMALLATLATRGALPRRGWLRMPLLLISAALVLSLAVGLIRHGPTTWALLNRGVGWVVILSYLTAGYAVLRNAGEGALEAVCRASVLAVSLVSALSVVVLVMRFVPPGVPPGLDPVAVSGFTFNANAFAFVGATMMVLGLMQVSTGRGSWLPLIPIAMAMGLSTARTSYVLAAMVIVAVPVLDRRLLRPVLGLVACALATKLVFPLVVEGLQLVSAQGEVVSTEAYFNMLLSKSSSDRERWDSIVGGLSLFASHPLVGAGLGGFLHARLAAGEVALVIHSVPVWVLAEMGVVGAALLCVAFATMAWTLWTRKATTYARFGLLAMGLFCAGGTVHDFFYQRPFWFVFGLAAALLSRVPQEEQALASTAEQRGSVGAAA